VSACLRSIIPLLSEGNVLLSSTTVFSNSPEFSSYSCNTAFLYMKAAPSIYEGSSQKVDVLLCFLGYKSRFIQSIFNGRVHPRRLFSVVFSLYLSANATIYNKLFPSFPPIQIPPPSPPVQLARQEAMTQAGRVWLSVTALPTPPRMCVLARV
jgi:hypothetical protein